MCEIAKSQRRTYRDQDPPRINETVRSGRSCEQSEDASGYYDGRRPDPDPDFFGNEQQQQHSRRKESASIDASEQATLQRDYDCSNGHNSANAGAHRLAQANLHDDHRKDNNSRESVAINQVPYYPSCLTAHQNSEKIITKEQVNTNGVKGEEDSCGALTNGREMAPVMGVPPPPPAPHMGPDGLILPRKPYNPCLISNNHKDLRRELQFNQKIGRSVLNQKSELQRALEKQRETKMRREAEKNREETYKDDPRTALQRALEQRAKHIQLTEQPQSVEPPNPLVDARAKLRTRTDSQ